MRGQSRSGKSTPAGYGRSGRSFFDAAIKRAFAVLVLAALPLFSDASFNNGISAFAAPEEIETRHHFEKAALKFDATGKLVIIAFGSSSTQGTGASSPDRSYPAVLQKSLNSALGPDREIRVINRGIGGEDVDTMMERLERDVLREKPDIVIWQTGSNDLMHDIPLARFMGKTRDGIRQMQDAGIAVLLMELQYSEATAGKTDCLAYRDAVRAIGEEMGVPVIKRYDMIQRWLADPVSKKQDLMCSDGLHMGDEGYRRLAAEVAAEIMQDLGIRAGLRQSLLRSTRP
jgi:lysophospholipase L1-like esterase